MRSNSTNTMRIIFVRLILLYISVSLFWDDEDTRLTGSARRFYTITLASSLPLCTSCDPVVQPSAYSAVEWNHSVTCEQDSSIQMSSPLEDVLSRVDINSSVFRGAVLSIIGFTTPPVALRNSSLNIQYNISIANAYFEGGRISMVGVFPPKCLITLQGNTFRVINDFQATVKLAVVELLSETRLTVDRNLFLLTPEPWNATLFDFRFLSLGLELSEHSVVNVCHNVFHYITNSSYVVQCSDPMSLYPSTTNIIYLIYVSNLKTLGGNGTILLQSNVANFTSLETPLILSLYFITLFTTSETETLSLVGGSELQLSQNIFYANLITNHSVDIMVVNIYFAVRIDASKLNIVNNTLHFTAPTPSNAFMVGIAKQVFSLLNTSSFIVSNNIMKVFSVAPLCFNPTLSYRSNVQFIRYTSCPYISLGENSSIVISSNLLEHPNLTNLLQSVTSQALIFQLLNCNMSAVESRITILNNTVLNWGQSTVIVFSIAAGSNQGMVYTLLESNITVEHNIIHQSVIGYNTMINAGTVSIMSLLFLRIMLARSLLFIGHNYYELNCSEVPAANPFITQVGVGYFYLLNGSTVVTTSNTFVGNISTKALTSNTAFLFWQVKDNAIVTSESIHRYIFNLSVCSEAKYDAFTDVLFNSSIADEPSLFTVVGNNAKIVFWRSIINDTFSSVTDIVMIVRILSSVMHVRQGCWIQISSNDVRLSGVSSAHMASEAHSIVRYTLSKCYFYNASIIIKNNFFDTTGSWQGPLIAAPSMRLFLSVESEIQISTIEIAQNRISMWYVILQPANAPTVNCSIFDSDSALQMSVGSLMLINNSLEYLLMDPNNDSNVVGQKGSVYVPTTTETKATFSFINFNGKLQSGSFIIQLMNNSLSVPFGMLTDIKLVRANIEEYNVVEPIIIQVCDNRANNNPRKFNDARVTLGDFRSSLRLHSMPDVSYELCQRMADLQTASITHNQSWTQTPTGTSNHSHSTSNNSRSNTLAIKNTHTRMSMSGSEVISSKSLHIPSNTTSLSRTPPTSLSSSAQLSNTIPLTLSQDTLVSHTLEPNQTSAPLIPVPAIVEASIKVKEVTGGIVAVSAVASTTGGQLGVANAMLRLANCGEDMLAEADEEELLPILVHPLRFNFGRQSYQKYSAAALSNTILVPLIVTAIALGPVRLLLMRVRTATSNEAMAQMGWPSLLVLPFANLAEGIGVSVVASIRSGQPFGIGVGLIGASVVITFVGAWLWVIIKIMPKIHFELRNEEGSLSSGISILRESISKKTKRRAFLWGLVRPSSRWVPKSDAVGTINEAFAERYNNVVGDKVWYYAELTSFLCSLTVGIIEGVPSTFCKERAIFALIPALGQCALSVLTVIPLERFLQSLLTLCLVPLYITMAVKVFNGSPSDEMLDTILAALSALGNVIGIAIMSLGLLVGIWDMVTTHRNSKGGSKARKRKASNAMQRSPDMDPLAIPMLQIDERKNTTSQKYCPPTAHPVPTSNMEEGFSSRRRMPHSTASSSENLVTGPPRTMEDVLDFVERTAIERSLSYN